MIAAIAVRTVAALCVANKTEYTALPAVECFDIGRDVRTFAGGMPVVAHPPCRSWSAYCAHQAKPLPGEKELGPLCNVSVNDDGTVSWQDSKGAYSFAKWDHLGTLKPGESKTIAPRP